MSNLDERLREIADGIYGSGYGDGQLDQAYESDEIDEAIAQIKQAFQDAGYKKPYYVPNLITHHKIYEMDGSRKDFYSDTSGSDMHPDLSPNAKERVTEL